MKIKRPHLPLFLLLPLLFLLPGCTVFNISLAPSVKPLEEKVLEGKGKPKILLLDLDGVISFKEATSSFGMKTTPSIVAFFREALLKAEKDKKIAGLIVRINSPGGGVTASDTIYHEIMNFRKKKKVPVYAFIMDVGASGGYYVAAAADSIIASPTAITGSIGVLAMKLNIEGLMGKIGVAEETYKSGPKKDFWSPFRPSTPEEKKMLQGIIDNLYARFVGVVYESRKKALTRDEVKALADGRILTAEQALDAKLVDKVGYLEDAVADMKKALKTERAKVVTYARPGSFKPTIYSGVPLPGQQIINLISFGPDEFASSSGVKFMYLWNP